MERSINDLGRRVERIRPWLYANRMRKGGSYIVYTVRLLFADDLRPVGVSPWRTDGVYISLTRKGVGHTRVTDDIPEKTRNPFLGRTNIKLKVDYRNP